MDSKEHKGNNPVLSYQFIMGDNDRPNRLQRERFGHLDSAALSLNLKPVPACFLVPVPPCIRKHAVPCWEPLEGEEAQTKTADEPRSVSASTVQVTSLEQALIS
jgi:hypothetical protein